MTELTEFPGIFRAFRDGINGIFRRNSVPFRPTFYRPGRNVEYPLYEKGNSVRSVPCM